MSYSKLNFCFILFSILTFQMSAQDEWEKQVNEMEQQTQETTATFKTTRLASSQTIEQVKAGVLDFRINHRFGRFSDGFDNFFGLDNAVTRIGFDYGITDYLMVGVGRSTLNKEYDGFGKVKILGQKGSKMPITLDYLLAASVVAEKYPVPNIDFFNRVSYINQLLIARKFNDKLSLQLMPTYVHYNMTQFPEEKNDLFAVGLGGRFKLTRRTALTLEYLYVPNNMKRNNNYNPLTIGLDVETGGHVFQLFVSNASGLTERSLFTASTSQWTKGELHFGFNISRVFTVN